MAVFPYSDQPDRVRKSYPYVVVGLVVLNVLVFLYELTLSAQALEMFVRSWGIIPAEIVTGQDLPPAIPVTVYATLITSQFLHGGFLHILANMIFLWVFGDNIEDALGHFTFLVFYLLAGIAAGLINAFILGMTTVPGIGASGAIAGVLAGYLLLFPRASVRTFLAFGPFFTVGRAAALLLIAAWFLMQLVQGIATIGAPTQQGGVAFFAHVGGFVFGLLTVPLIRAAEGKGVGNLAGGVWLGSNFGRWLLLILVLGLLLGGTTLLAAAGYQALASLLQGLIILGALIFAAVDAFRRISGQSSFLNSRTGFGQFLAYVQLIVAVGGLVALLTGIL